MSKRSPSKIDITSARLVIDESVLPRFNPAARGEIYGLDVNDAKLIATLGQKELENQTVGSTWKDYGVYEQTAWSGWKTEYGKINFL